MDVHAAAVCFELHVPESRSLKSKRAAIRPIVDGLRHRFKVSVAEVAHQDTWQRAAIGVALVDASVGHLQEVLDSVERFVASAADVELLDVDTTWIGAGEAELTEWEVEPGATRDDRAGEAELTEWEVEPGATRDDPT
jgi:uncharacterized protein YlxP (DUF503 family)